MITYHSNYKNGKPPNNLRRKAPWRVALIANVKNEYEPDEEEPPDAGAEFDSIKTIEYIATALESDGHWVHFLQADYTLPESITNLHPHIVFNIAEGLQGDGREAHVPSLCELMGIPYTASQVVASAVSLDKTLCKRIWRDSGLPTARFYEIHNPADLDKVEIPFPLFVKPAREGSGMGISGSSIIRNRKELIKQVTYILETYHQPALVEEFLSGREFTVGFIGNPGSPAQRRQPQLYDQDGYHWFPIMEIDSNTSVSPAVYGHDAKTRDIGEEGAPGYLCPANISPELQDQLISLTKQAAEALNVCDASRVDIRLGADQKPYLMEINTLPGLNPELSDLCIMAASEGLGYQTLITEILYLAAERYGMPLPDKDHAEASLISLPTYQFQHPAASLSSKLS
jgi:D-alanine--D-alanine ligase